MDKKYDIIVTGGGPAGINAALSAARMNKSVLLIERYGFLGGMSTIAEVYPWMTFHDANGNQVIKGIAEEIVQELMKRNASPGHLLDTCGFVQTVTPFEKEEFKLLALELLHQENVTVLLHTTLSNVAYKDDKIVSVDTVSKSVSNTFFADVFIDTTGDADLCYMAGVPTELGEHDSHQVQPMTLKFRMRGVDINAVREAVLANPENFLSDTPFDQLREIPLTAVQGFYQEWKDANLPINRDQVLFFIGPGTDEVVVNMTRIQRLNPLDPSDLSKAELIGRQQITLLVNFFQKQIPGFKKAHLSSVAPQVGIRESRRMLGVYSLTKEDIQSGTIFEDTIAQSSYPIDLHSPTDQSMEIASVGGNGVFGIPYRCLITDKFSNLLTAGRSISATHQALASVRLTPSAMATGQAAGTAAALCLTLGSRTTELPIDVLKKQLIVDGVHLG